MIRHIKTKYQFCVKSQFDWKATKMMTIISKTSLKETLSPKTLIFVSPSTRRFQWQNSQSHLQFVWNESYYLFLLVFTSTLFDRGGATANEGTRKKEELFSATSEMGVGWNGGQREGVTRQLRKMCGCVLVCFREREREREKQRERDRERGRENTPTFNSKCRWMAKNCLYYLVFWDCCIIFARFSTLVPAKESQTVITVPDCVQTSVCRQSSNAIF